MFSRGKLFFLCAPLLLSLGACINVLRDFPDKSSDGYLIDRARNSLDKYDWDDALDSIAPVLAANPKLEEVNFIAATAYAGKSGLRVLDLFVRLGSDISTKTLLTIFAQHFPGAGTTEQDAITSAINVVQAFGATAADRTSQINLLAMFLYYGRIGIVLQKNALLATNDVRTNFTACKKSVSFAGAKTGITDDDVDTVMISLAGVLDTVGSISGSGGAFSALKTNLAVSSLPTTPLPCSTAAGADLVKCLAVRTLINVGSPTGIGLGTANDIATFPESPGGVCAATIP